MKLGNRVKKRLGASNRGQKKVLGLLAWVIVLILIGRNLFWKETQAPARMSKEEVAAKIAPSLRSNQFPNEIPIQGRGYPKAFARYTLNLDLQHRMERVLEQYRPDYAAFVVMDAKTGRVLVLASYTRAPVESENLTLKASFPAASIFKIVTVAAAMDQGMITSDTVIPFNGANHTLYRRNVTDPKIGRWTRQITVRDAFAKSVNTVFGKIGMYILEPMQLQEYAERFQFNKTLTTDLPVEPGQLALPVSDNWGLAELASGFNRVSSMSPLQGALIAAAVANDGVMMEPYIVEGLSAPDGTVLYESNPVSTSITMKADTAASLQALMRETVISGTSRSAFRTLLKRSAYQNLEIGGKTGSLKGTSPKGKCDWFVGYVRSPSDRLAIAALTVNEDKWRVKASHLARVFIENRYAPPRTARR